MDPNSTTAGPSFDIMGLPREVRDDIYEDVIFDLSPPDLFLRGPELDPAKFRNMNTNILLTNRKVYNEALDVIERRAQLVLVSATPLRPGVLRNGETPMGILTANSGITMIHPKYRNLCIMTHHIDSMRSSDKPNANERGIDSEFILHRREIKSFCFALMGKFHNRTQFVLIWKPSHTLIPNFPPTYAQQKSKNVYAMHAQLLHEYRNVLHGFWTFSICGTSAGWVSGLYAAVLQDICSTKRLAELVDDIRDLEQGGSQILQQTGDLEAANVSWTQAIAICNFARRTFIYSDTPSIFATSPAWTRALVPNATQIYTERWIRLRRANGNNCADPITELWYKLINNRLSAVLQLIRTGGHLATRHGRAPGCTQDYVHFVHKCYSESATARSFIQRNSLSRRPSEQAQLYCMMATIFRLLNATEEAVEVYGLLQRADDLSPDDPSIQQEMRRIKAWIRRLVGDGTLESYPRY